MQGAPKKKIKIRTFKRRFLRSFRDVKSNTKISIILLLFLDFPDSFNKMFKMLHLNEFKLNINNNT